MKLTLIAAFAALSITAAFGQANSVAEKPPAAPPSIKAGPAPVLQTATFWRLVAQTQSLREQLAQTEPGKALKEAEGKLQAEQIKLASACGTNFVLGYQTDAKADNSGDVICTPKPVEPVPGKPDAPKGK